MSWLWLLVALLLLLDGLRVRGRRASVPVLSPSDEPVSPDHRFLVAPGVELDEATRRAASAHARREGIDLLELVPARLPALRAWAFFQFVVPEAYRKDPLARGLTAGHATLVLADVLERARTGAAPQSQAAFARAACALRPFSARADLALVPALRPVPVDRRTSLEVLRASIGGSADLVVVAVPILLAILAGAAAAGGVPGLCALLAYQLQPLVGLGGAAPAGSLVLTTLLRPLLDALDWLRLVTSADASDPAGDEARRARYEKLLAGGTAPFFEARRPDCPLCGGKALRPLVSVPDLFQAKPGRFTLERCEGCGHTFQNPRLSLEGLSFYYGDFYDGLGADEAEALFSSAMPHYHDRVGLVASVLEAAPRRWLDVGAGHGHFCRIAKDRWPEARFDGLDLSQSVEEAERRRWIDHAIRGLFPEEAPALAGRYDVVSMSHYLEHTRDPAAELRAACTALAAGGVLLVEVPDPEHPIARVLGRFWLPYFQPQHQHLLRAAGLERLLRESGLVPVVWHRGQAHQPVDFWAGAYLFLSWLAPKPDLPWRPRHGRGRRLWRTAVLTAGAPLVALGRLLDLLARRAFERGPVSNTYRVVARKTG